MRLIRFDKFIGNFLYILYRICIIYYIFMCKKDLINFWVLLYICRCGYLNIVYKLYLFKFICIFDLINID